MGGADRRAAACSIGTLSPFTGYKTPFEAPNPAFMRRKLACSIVLFTLLFIATGAAAQEPIGIRVASLTSSERDTLNARAQRDGTLKVVYACAPAGVIVFEGQGAERENFKAKAEALVSALVPASRITAITITLQQAMDACQNVRDQQ